MTTAGQSRSEQPVVWVESPLQFVSAAEYAAARDLRVRVWAAVVENGWRDGYIQLPEVLHEFMGTDKIVKA